MNPETLITLLIGLLQAIALGVLGRIVSKTTENGELLATLAEKSRNAEAKDVETRAQLAEIFARLNRIELENARLSAEIHGSRVQLANKI